MFFEAAELLTTGTCPLNCKYCYIPKTEAMKDLHKDLIQDLQEESYFDRLEEVAGEDLKTLGLWGTEPALTLDLIEEKLDSINSRFPKLETISFSTSMMIPDPIEHFIKCVSESEHDIKLDIQISLDGPAFITDKNRKEGAAKEVPKNFFNLLSNIQEVSSEVDFKWKATFADSNMQEMNQDPNKIDQYFDYFKSLNEKFDQINTNENISLKKGSYNPTLMVPGKYSSKKGEEFAEFLKKVHSKRHFTTYFPRLMRLKKYQDEMGRKRRMFSCSGGDSNVGVDNDKVHICHRSFYLNDERYVKSIFKKGDIDNWDVSLFEQGSIGLMNKNYIVDNDDEGEFLRFKYALRNYHDFWKMQITYVKAMMKELALAGQAEKRFLEDEEYTILFALFINSALSCPMEALLNTGSLHLTPISMLRMFGNGAFQEILDYEQCKQ